MRSDLPRKLLAAVVSIAVVAAASGVPLAAAELARFQGRVLDADGASPRSGVIVTLVDASGETTYDSRPSDDRGVFRVEEAPAGTYAVLARAPEGNFLAGGRVALVAGDNPAVSLALLPQTDPATPDDADKDDDDDEGAAAPPPPSPPPPSGGLPTWGKWVITGAIIVGGVGLVQYLSEEEDPGSPF